MSAEVQTRQAECVDCHAPIVQERAGVYSWAPLRCPPCDVAMDAKARARTQFFKSAAVEHNLKNALSFANLRGEIAEGRLTLDRLPELYAETRIAGGVPIYRYTEIVNLVKDFVAVPPLLRGPHMASLLLLHGEPGTGKTWLLEAAIGYVVRELHRSGIFTSPLKMWADVKASADDYGIVSEQRVVAELTNCAALGIDDIARKPSPTEWEMSMLLQVVDERYRQNRPTLITSNLDVSALFALWSDSGDSCRTRNVKLLCDRLSDKKAAISIAMSGKSLRREGRIELTDKDVPF